MVIGIEGNVHVGKTTFINNSFINYQIIKETNFIQELQDFDRQIYYITEEKNKKLKYNSNDIVMDRTLISTAIYCFYSGVFDKKEKEKFKKIIDDCIINNKVLIPKIIYYINYPFDLICKNHEKLYIEKGTQSSLVDYDYYLKYNLFFSNNIDSYIKCNTTNDFRQILEFDGKKLFKNLTTFKKITSRVMLDGAPAIGKSTIGSIQTKYQYIPEFKYKSYTLENYTNQLDSIIERINLLNRDNIMADTSFLMGLTHLFYNKETTKKFKLSILSELMSSIPLCLYTTKIIYLLLDKNLLLKRKNNDLKKVRKHFEDNIGYLEKEIKFYKTLNNSLGNKSNIHLIDANKTPIELARKIENINDKPLLLIDLFYCIYTLVERGEL